MLRWFNRKIDRSVQLGVSAVSGGLAAAIVKHRAGAAPQLQWAAAIEGDEPSGALAQLAQERVTRGINCIGTVASSDYSLVMVEAPDVPPAEMRAAVRWRLNEMIDFHIDDAVVDIFDVPQAAGARAGRIYAVAARAAAVKRNVDEYLASGLQLEVLDIPEFALRNIAELLPEDVHGVAFIALDSERGLMTITRQGGLYLSRRLEYGTARLFNLDHGMISAASEGALDTLVIEIQRSFDYYERHFAQPPVQAVVFGPCVLPLTSVCAYLQSQLGVAVRVLDLNELLPSTLALDAALQATCLTAIGTALRREEVAL